MHNLEHFFTLSYTLPLHDSHLNIRLLIAKIQANLARNKANKMVDKIQPYRENTYIDISARAFSIIADETRTTSRAKLIHPSLLMRLFRVKGVEIP